MTRQNLQFGLGLSLMWLGLIYSYSSTLGYGLLDYDDPAYLTENTGAKQPLLSINFWKELGTSATVNLWHPLTVLSHQLMLRLTSSWGWHHLINLLCHGGVATLWAITMRRLSGNHVAALIATLFFAWHPATVESVAWLSGRKDLLCSLLLVSMIWGHIHWVRKQKRTFLYLSFAFGCGAMLSKPVACVAPLILLALDYGPLQRRENSTRVWREKTLWLIPSLLTVGLTLKFQAEGTQAVIDSRSLVERGAGAIWALEHAITSITWPTQLYHGYQDPQTLKQGHLLTSLLLFSCLLLFAFCQRRKMPYFLCGMIFLLLTLGPTLGIIRVGNHLAADRYVYLPLIGISLLMVGILKNLPKQLSLILACLSLPLLFLQKGMVEQWENLETLFHHTLRHDPNNPQAHTQLANIYENKGDRAQAQSHLKKALTSEPSYVSALLLSAQINFQEEDWLTARNQYRQAFQIRTTDPAILEIMAHCSLQLQDPSSALQELKKAIELADDAQHIKHLENTIFEIETINLSR